MAHVFRQRIFHMNVKLRMYEYCYSNLGAIYAKDLLVLLEQFVIVFYNLCLALVRVRVG